MAAAQFIITLLEATVINVKLKISIFFPSLVTKSYQTYIP